MGLDYLSLKSPINLTGEYYFKQMLSLLQKSGVVLHAEHDGYLGFSLNLRSFEKISSKLRNLQFFVIIR